MRATGFAQPSLTIFPSRSKCRIYDIYIYIYLHIYIYISKDPYVFDCFFWITRKYRGPPKTIILDSGATKIVQTRSTGNAYFIFGYGVAKHWALNHESVGKTRKETHRKWSHQFLKTLHKEAVSCNKQTTTYFGFSIQLRASIPLILLPPCMRGRGWETKKALVAVRRELF